MGLQRVSLWTQCTYILQVFSFRWEFLLSHHSWLIKCLKTIFTCRENDFMCIHPVEYQILGALLKICICTSTPTLLCWHDSAQIGSTDFVRWGQNWSFRRYWNNGVDQCVGFCTHVCQQVVTSGKSWEFAEIFTLPFPICFWLPVSSAVVWKTLKSGCWSAEIENRVNQKSRETRGRQLCLWKLLCLLLLMHIFKVCQSW